MTTPDSDTTPDTESEEQTTADRVETALRHVRDPTIGMNVFEAGLIENIHVEGDAVRIEADVSEFDPNESDDLMTAMVRAARDVPGVERAHVEPARPDTDTSDREGGVEAFDTVIAVASAKGGVGKSTVAASLACSLAESAPTGLFDADVYGPNIPTLLDVSGPVHSDADGNPLPITVKRGDGELEVISVGAMESGAPLAWRGAMAHDAISELFADTAWSDGETLILDLPPGTGDIVLTTLQEVPVDGVVTVTTPFQSSIADTNRSIELFRDNGVPVLGAVVNMTAFECPSCGDEHDLFPYESIADDLDAPVLGEMPFETEIQETLSPGQVPEPFVSLAPAVRAELDHAGEVDCPDDAVDIRGMEPQKRKTQVRESFENLSPGDSFTVVSDRDPAPIRGFLASLTDVAPPQVPIDIERATPNACILRTERP
jgi:ATP-binding protein involved in chromosome partitioning